MEQGRFSTERANAKAPVKQHLIEGVRSWWLALFVLTAIPLFYSGGQEIIAVPGSRFDDHYYLLRSRSFTMDGYPIASIKEYLYSLFIALSDSLALNLRTLEVIGYGGGLFLLWVHIKRVTCSSGMAWMAVLPLAFLTYQHPVFNRATSDSLQLILTPITFASALYIISAEGNRRSVVFSGCVAALQVLTRPEGILFLAPPLIALLFACWLKVADTGHWSAATRFIRKAILVVLIPVGLQQGMSAVNYVTFGFWAPTIMKSSGFSDCLSALMAVKPVAGDYRFAPVPIPSLTLAYEASPSFRKAKPYFDMNLMGRGWSGYASEGYSPLDGSIGGGHFQWALLEASSNVAGPSTRAMLAYLEEVTAELNAAFQSGKIQKRRVLSTALGPDFTPLSSRFWTSASRITRSVLNLHEVPMPFLSGITADATLEDQFNHIAHRRTVLVEQEWQTSGWIDHSAGILPVGISLDETAANSGTSVKILPRYISDGSAGGIRLLFDVRVKGSGEGNILIQYPKETITLPVERLRSFRQGRPHNIGAAEISVQKTDFSKLVWNGHLFTVVTLMSNLANHLMRVLMLLAPVSLAVVLLLSKKLPDLRLGLGATLVILISLSVLLPRLALLSGIDANMYPGTEHRYLAAAAFSMWLLSSYLGASVLRALLRLKRRQLTEANQLDTTIAVPSN